MSRRGNCLDNAVAESFFNLLKRERIRRKTYRMREKARQDVFDDIEMFHNPKRKHVRNGMRSPVAFERRHNSSPMASTKLGALHLIVVRSSRRGKRCGKLQLQAIPF